MIAYLIDPLSRMQDCFVLRPVKDSIPWRTWRTAYHEAPPGRPHRYPAEGCHGEPLQNDFPSRTDGP